MPKLERLHFYRIWDIYPVPFNEAQEELPAGIKRLIDRLPPDSSFSGKPETWEDLKISDQEKDDLMAEATRAPEGSRADQKKLREKLVDRYWHMAAKRGYTGEARDYKTLLNQLIRRTAQRVAKPLTELTMPDIFSHELLPDEI